MVLERTELWMRACFDYTMKTGITALLINSTGIIKTGITALLINSTSIIKTDITALLINSTSIIKFHLTMLSVISCSIAILSYDRSYFWLRDEEISVTKSSYLLGNFTSLFQDLSQWPNHLGGPCCVLAPKTADVVEDKFHFVLWSEPEWLNNTLLWVHQLQCKLVINVLIHSVFQLGIALNHHFPTALNFKTCLQLKLVCNKNNGEFELFWLIMSRTGRKGETHL